VSVCGYVLGVCGGVLFSINLGSSRHVVSQYYVLSVRYKWIKDFTLNDITVSRIECVVHFAMN